MSWLVFWWRQSDHYEQLSSHLRARGMGMLTRSTIASIAALLALVAIATIWTPTGPRGGLQIACALAAGVGAAVGALIWGLRWPTRAAAIRFALLSNASIALVALAQDQPLAAMLTCTTFATMATYIALFHAAPLMVYNFVIAALVGAFEVVRMTAAYNLTAALCGYFLLLTLNLAAPFGIQTVVHVLGADAVRAERDQLTGLLNRGAFHRRANKRLQRDGADLPVHLVVTVIDLDRFKQLNDRFGHRTGDDALVAVARALRENTDDTAVIGRVGGEEFAIADSWHPDEVEGRAQTLCEAIAALPFEMTASLGTAGVYLSSRTNGRETGHGDLLLELMSAADAAMYVAKRGGGNRASHHRPRLAADADRFSDELGA
jgi:diguanylate cyclase (GGDEF)-like protein